MQQAWIAARKDDTLRHGSVCRCQCNSPCTSYQMREISPDSVIETYCCDVKVPQTLLPPRGAEELCMWNGGCFDTVLYP